MRFSSNVSISVLLGVFSLALGTADAKPGKGNRGKGGPPAHAQEKGQKKKGPARAGKGTRGVPPGHARKQDHGSKKRGPGFEEIVGFESRDRRHVLDYFSGYREREHGLPPGLAKNLRRGNPLPPGWRKKLSAGHVIEDDWWSRLVPMPYSRFPDLEPTPETGLYLYGDRMFRVYEPQRRIVDVIAIPTININL